MGDGKDGFKGLVSSRPVAELSTEVGQIDSALSAFLSNRTGETHRSFTFDDASFHETLAVACIDAVERYGKTHDVGWGI